jgi:zinc/manganese transport system permease protein
MLLVALATSIAVQVVGVLLIFSLMVTPAAIAQRLAKRPWKAVLLSLLISLSATWVGLTIAFYEPYPVSFFITTIVFVLYVLVRFLQPKVNPMKARKTALQSGVGSPETTT